MRLLSLDSGGATHATRGSVAKTPYFLETVSCLVVIMGETGDSGHGLGFGEIARLRGLPPLLGTFCRVPSGRPTRFEIRADTRQFGKISLCKRSVSGEEA